jgi:hypothetical protein
MNEAPVATVRAQYRLVDGYHVFTSEDVRGLYVASKNAREAFDSVRPVLEQLISLKLKVRCEIEPVMSFDQFMAYIEARDSVRDIPSSPTGSSSFGARRRHRSLCVITLRRSFRRSSRRGDASSGKAAPTDTSFG